tara:strand:- start:202 stop:312 length:111 start_codon:yes stop_codon:yes gene_type:complete
MQGNQNRLIISKSNHHPTNKNSINVRLDVINLNYYS